jgi:hypothetical protein
MVVSSSLGTSAISRLAEEIRLAQEIFINTLILRLLRYQLQSNYEKNP